MNCIYRLVWSDQDQALRAVAETARGRRKCSGSGIRSRIAAALASLAFLDTAIAGGPPPTSALPTAPTVVAGQASVSSKGNLMQITESTNSAIINWGSFNIGSAAAVNIVQPGASSVLLNRVLSADASQIFGTLTANGTVFLVNSQGVIFGRGASVDVGALVASGLDISNADFLARNWTFSGTPGGSVTNAGAIHVAPGGFAALIGGHVDNTGSISARMGSVALAAGAQLALDLDAAGLLRVGISQAALDAQVHNGGAIIADGGRIVLTARAAGELLGSVVNNDGLLQAQGIGVHDGQVWLLAADALANTGATGAAAHAGTVRNAAGGVATSGTIDVQGDGGTVTLAGTTVDISGTINASGSGGHVLADSTAQTTLAASGHIDVSGTNGRAVLWSDGATTAHGIIDGQGAGTGTGASVEVSAAGTLNFDAQVALGAAAPALSGTLLLDPATLEIAAGAGTATANTLYQNTLQQQSGNIVLSATGQVTIDALTNNALNLANATGLSITSDSTGGIRFLNNASGQPSAIVTHGAPVTLTASGSGSIDNVGNISTSGGNIDLGGVYVHLAGGLDATNGGNAPGNVAIAVFGGGLLSSSTSPIAGGQVTLDATYGYVGTAQAPIPTATANLSVLTGGNAYVANSTALSALSLTSNHLEGTPVGVAITASNLNLSGADAAGDGSIYSGAVHWTQYSASVPGAAAAPASVTISEDGNLLPGTINLPATTVNLASRQGYILGGNAQPLIAAVLNASSPLGIGGTDFNGINAETDGANPGAAGGNTLLIQAGSVRADVLDSTGSIAGIANISQRGNLAGSVEASAALLQATGTIGSSAQHFTLDVGNSGEAYNVAAGSNAYLDINYTLGLTVANAQAAGSLLVDANARTSTNGALFQQVSAGGNATLNGSNNPNLVVQSISSTNGSIAVTGDQNVEVDAATLNGVASSARSISVGATAGTLTYGALSTDGAIASTITAAPVGTITLNSPLGIIQDLSAAGGSALSELRSGSAVLSGVGGIQINNTAVDTATAVTLLAGQVGAPCCFNYTINATLSGIDSTSDPAGAQPHSVHILNSTDITGNTNLSNTNGDLRIGQVNSYWSNGSGATSGQSLTLTASGSILPDGTIGGGALNAGDWYGNITLSAGGSLGQRGTGAGGLTGAGFLEINGTGNYMNFTTGGDLFVHNTLSQGPATYYETLTLSAHYAGATTPAFYHYQSGSAGNILAGTPTMAFDGVASGGTLTLTNGSVDSAGGNTLNLTGDGNLRISSFSVGNSAYINFNAQNITLDPQAAATPTFSVGDNSTLNITAAGALNLGSLASGQSTLNLVAQAGNLTLGKVGGVTTNVNVTDAGGDILGAVGNRVLADNLNLANSTGAIGADPSLGGSLPVAIGVVNQLNINNGGGASSGGGSINLLTLNDPATLQLNLAVPSSGSYAGAHYSFAPQTTGLGFSGYADSTGITLQTLGTTGSNPAAVALSLTADAPRIGIASGAGSQLGIGYDLYFGSSYSTIATNLAGSAGQLVTVHADSNPNLSSLTGTLALTNLSIDTNTLSGGPLAVNYTLAQALSVLDITRNSTGGNDLAYYPGNSLALAGSGQNISVVEATGPGGAHPGSVQFGASSNSSLTLNYQYNLAGSVNLGNVALGGTSTLNVGVASSGNYAPLGSAITSNPGTTVAATTVNLTASSDQPGMASLGTQADPLVLNATNVSLSTTGNIHAGTSAALRSLAITSTHPNWVGTGTGGDVSYAISGPALTLALQDTGFQQTALSTLSASVPLTFSLTTDASITVGSVNAGPNGTVNLASNVGYANNGVNTTASQTGIFQGSGSGISAGTVNLTASGYQGAIGGASVLDVATPNLNMNFTGSLNVADASALQSLALTVGHTALVSNGQYPTNTYALSAPNVNFQMTDASSYAWYSNIQLENLTSPTLTNFSLTATSGSILLGNFNGTDYSAGQINLAASGSSVSINAANRIWGSSGAASYLPDQASGIVSSNAAAVVANSLSLTAGSYIDGFPNAAGASSTVGAEQQSIPVEVNHLSVSTYLAYVTNVGNLDLASASTTIGFFRAIESAPGVAASITSSGTVAASNNLGLVAYYGSIGQGSGAPVVVNTPSLDVESGADIAVHDTGSLSTLAITSNHYKAAINDTSNGGLNSISISDSGAGAMQLGATDLGVAGGGYQITGMNAPSLSSMSFTSDTSISVGSIAVGSTPAGSGAAPANPGTVAITSTGGSILQITGDTGQVAAQTLTLTASTTGDSIGMPGTPVRVNAPGLTVNTGGNMVIADSAAITSFALNIGAVTDLGSTPSYTLDNSAAAHPMTMSLAGDTVNNVLDINSITVTRTDAPVALSVNAASSAIGMGAIADNAASGGTISIGSSYANVFGLGGLTSATGVTLSAGSNLGDDTSGASAPVNVSAQNVTASSNGDLRLTSPGAINALTLTQNNGSLTAGTWSVNATGFTLAGHMTVNGGGGGILDISSVQDSATNLAITSNTPVALGTLAMGTGSLGFTVNNNGAIDSDGSNGSTPNIVSGTNVNLYSGSGIGETTQITTDIAGLLSLNTISGPISVAQTTTTPLNVGSLGIQYWFNTNLPVTLGAAGTINFTQNVSGASSSSSGFTVNAGGDVNLPGSLQIYNAPLSITAGGNITSSVILGTSTANLTAGGALNVSNIDYIGYNQGPASGAITLHAANDVTISGHVDSSASVSITSTQGSIFGQDGSVFDKTPSVTLNAAGDIGSGSSASLSALALNGPYCYNPIACNSNTALTLSVQAGGRAEFTSYSTVNAAQLLSGGNLNLQVYGDPNENVNAGISVGTVQSTGGSVTLGTYQGSITAASSASAISAASAITVSAGQSSAWWSTGYQNTNVYGIGSALSPLVVNAPQVNLTANGGIYAQVPTTGLTDLAVSRTVVPVSGTAPLASLGTWMPAGTIAITNGLAQSVLYIADGGWASGGVSGVTASYGSALNLSYTAYDAIVLGNVNLSGGNLALGVNNPSNISITSQGGLIQANNFSFSLNDTSGTGAATGGFGTAANPINTQITALSGSTVGPHAGVFIDQTGPITFTNLTTGGDIAITTVSGGVGNSGAVYIGNVSSNGGSVSINAAGPIGQATGVSAPTITAAGPANDGGVTLRAGAAINLESTAIDASNAGVSITTTAGSIGFGSITAAGNVTLNAAAGIAGQAVTSQTGYVNENAQFGDIDFASIVATAGAVTLSAQGNILGTAPAQNLTGLADGITAAGVINLGASGALGSASVPLALNQTTGGQIQLSSGVGYDTHAVLGSAGATGSVILEAGSGGTLDLANFYPSVLLDNVSSTGNLTFTQLSNHATVLLNQVSASGPGAMAIFDVPYGDISASSPSSQLLASRIVLNALGDASGGSLGTTGPVDVNANVVLAVASGNISLNSLANGATKMPLVASNGATPTVTITSAGDFLVGQIVAGQQGSVAISSAANIYDDQDATTRIYAGSINLQAAGAIGTTLDPVQTTAQTYNGAGVAQPGNISAATTAAGGITLDQQGDAVLGSLTTANGAIKVLVHDQASGLSTLTLANSAATDATGNNIDVTVSNGSLAVNQAIAGLSNGVVTLNAPQGSVLGIAQVNCCVTPNVVGSVADVTAQNAVGQITSFAGFAGTPLAIEAGQSSLSVTGAGAQVYVQYYGNAVVGSQSSLQISAPGAGDQVIVAACGNLSLAGLSLPNATLGLNAVAGSVLDDIGGGAGVSTPSASAASVTIAAAGSIGGSTDALWLNTGTISATAGTGGAWISSTPSTPVTVASVTATGGPVVLTGQGNLLIDSVNAGTGSASLASVAGSVLDGSGGSASVASPNVTAGTVTLSAASNVGSAADALWVNAGTINASASSGGAWINSAASTPVTVASVTTAGGPVVITGKGDLNIDSINAGSGAVTLASVGGSVLDGTGGSASAAAPNVSGGTVTLSAASNLGSASGALWVNAGTINAHATSGGAWIDSAASTATTVGNVTTAGGPVVITGQGNLLIDSVSAGSGAVTLASAAGSVLDGTGGTASAAAPNVSGSTVTLSAASNVGSASHALWVNAGTINAHATSGGAWIDSAASTAATVGNVTTSGGPVVLTAQGDLLVSFVDAGSGAVTLASVAGSLLDGTGGSANAASPNITAGSFTSSAHGNEGSAGTPLWVAAPLLNASATAGGIWLDAAASTPVTVGSVTTAGGPVVITGQGDMLIDAVHAGTGAVTLASVTGSVRDGTSGTASAAAPNVSGGTVTLSAASNIGAAGDAPWVNAGTINATAGSGGAWINSAASTPTTIGSVTTTGGPVVITGQGNLLIQSVNAGTGAVTLASVAGSVLDGTGGTASAAAPEVTAGSVTVSTHVNAGSATTPLWVAADTLNAASATGGVWISSANSSAVTVGSVTTAGGTIVLSGQGDLLIGSVDAGLGSVTLSSATGSILDGTSGAANAVAPNVTAGVFTGNAQANVGSATTHLWVDADTINATASTGGVWINSVDATPVTIGTVSATAGGPVVISGPGDLVVDTINAGSGSVTLSSTGGGILDGLPGGSSKTSPNITAGTTTLTAGTSVGVATDPVWVEPGTYTITAPGGQWINVAPVVLTPYPYLPLIPGVSPVTFFSANAQSQTGPAQDLPITAVGLPMQLVPPIEVATHSFGLTLPEGNATIAGEQDASMGTASPPIEGGNEDEVGRKKVTLKKKADAKATSDKGQP